MSQRAGSFQASAGKRRSSSAVDGRRVEHVGAAAVQVPDLRVPDPQELAAEFGLVLAQVPVHLDPAAVGVLPGVVRVVLTARRASGRETGTRGTTNGVLWNCTSFDGIASLYQEKPLMPPMHLHHQVGADDMRPGAEDVGRVRTCSCSAVDGCVVPLEIWNGLSNAQRCPRTVKLSVDDS